MRETFVSFEEAAFSYDGEHFVFEELDLAIEQGSFTCILGGNGSGKSTLAKHVNALLLPDRGTVYTFGRDTRDEESTYYIRSNAGMVFQSPDDQLVASIVEDDIAFGPENLGIENPELAQRVKSALEEVGLQGFEKHETTALSGGQKQRVAIAGALAMDPAILILDEASSMLDPRGRAGLMRVCRELHEAGMTIIMITHFMEEAAHADRVVVLDKGRVCLDGAPSEVLAQASELTRLNLDVPFACQLSIQLQKLGVPVATCITEEEIKEELCRLHSSR
ncbi:MAG: energy-coupling factor transporter ATPase [Eggerthellaceae bacterium]|nr:energy-coupling factor transporter ATPase [Eggerthellaceae bacterium]